MRQVGQATAHSRKMEAPVVIVGGGIVGCAAAYYLARRGVCALLLERRNIGGEASGRSAGGVRAQCRARSERLLAMASIKLWEGLEAELGMDVEYVQGGNIRLAVTEERMADLSREAEEELEDGLAVEVWDREQMRERAPFLGDVFIGAKYCPSDGVANSILATWAYAWAAERAGAMLKQHTEVVGVELHNGAIASVTARDQTGELRIETPVLIHAAGPWTPQLGRDLGLHIPVEPSRALIAVTQPMPFLFSEFLSSHDLGVYARPARLGHMHVGGTAVPARVFDQNSPPDMLHHLARSVDLAPVLRNASFLRTWAGTLAMTPDHLPILGPVEDIQGYLLATGFSGHGFCLGPLVGKLMSEIVVEGKPSMTLDAFSLTRFAGEG